MRVNSFRFSTDLWIVEAGCMPALRMYPIRRMDVANRVWGLEILSETSANHDLSGAAQFLLIQEVEGIFGTPKS